MHTYFLQWFDRYARFFTLSWPVIVVYGSVVEILGFLRKNGTTFTDFVRNIAPCTEPFYLSLWWWIKAVLMLVLCYHFLVAKSNFFPK